MTIRGLGFKRICVMLLAFMVSCTPLFQAQENSNSKRDENHYEGPGEGLVYLRNPIVEEGANVGVPDYHTNSYSRLITTNSSLVTKCFFKQYNYSLESETANDCFQVLLTGATDETPISITSDQWNVEPGSEAYYQVNAFYHVNSMIEKVSSSMEFAHSYQFQKFIWRLPSATKFDLADTKAYWLTSNTITQTLKVITRNEVEVEDYNAFFSPAENKLAFGYTSSFQNRMIQDPSIIYHELGHVFVKVLLNQRNVWINGFTPEATTFQAELGNLTYDEGGAINEGLADFFSYYMNGRTHLGEWALGPNVNASRPMTETDSLHYATFTDREKLSYPKYVHYNPNSVGEVEEAKHNAGQITSHYLVALHKELQAKCTFPANTTGKSQAQYLHDKAGDYMIMLLSETLAELGDLKAQGSDFFNGQGLAFTNLNENFAYEWAKSVDTANKRKFYKVFAKNILHNISLDLCPTFTQDLSEELLDKYGLLLFKKYDDHGVGRNIASSATINYDDVTPTALPGVTMNFQPLAASSVVNEFNRVNSVLIAKDNIALPTSNSGLNTGYLIDSRSEIEAVIANLNFKGVPVATSTGLAGVEYNNNNLSIGPGEIVGLSLNLINNSNSTMGGVQILANDWDHMKLTDNTKTYVNVFANQNDSVRSALIANTKPCKIDGWPSISEGAVEDTTTNIGDCNHSSIGNTQIEFEPTDVIQQFPKYALDAPQPICLVKFSDDNEQTWVSQDFFRRTHNIEDTDCLNYSLSGNQFNPNSCLVRVLPGADQAHFAKIDPGKTWAQTVTQTGNELVLKSGNVVLMEINKETPPGAVFTCRFRARMSNCQDCYTDENGDPYRHSDFSGNKPYKVINFEFQVTE